MNEKVILQVVCPDGRGLVAKLANFVFANNGNIIDADHHTDHGSGLFLTRIEWELAGFDFTRDQIAQAFSPLGESLKADWQLHFSDTKPRIAVWVSKQEHCLLDLIWRIEAGDLEADIALVVSNHRDLEPIALRHGLPFLYLPMSSATKAQQEEKALSALSSARIDLIVLAKYMQILSQDFLNDFPEVINIHHSFLPAFAGAQPYHRAYERGVKIIGATAHYVTKDLDEGPIIEQDVVRISHRDSVQELIRKGKDLERTVLSRGLKLHLDRRVLVFNNKTVVFS